MKKLFCLAVLGLCWLQFSNLAVFGQARSASTGKITIQATRRRAVITRLTGNLTATERGKAVVMIVTDPPQAEVFIDGTLIGTSNDEGAFRAELRTGKEYQVEVKKDRYLQYKQAVKIDSADPALVQADLPATFGSIKIYNVPPDAKILLDNQPAPVSIDETEKQAVITDVTGGQHKLTISHPNFVLWDKEVDVIGGYDTGIAPELIAAAKLKIQTMPGTEVLIDNVKQGLTSATGELLVPTPLQPGAHEVTLIKAGYVTEQKPINLQANVQNSLLVEELEPTPSYVELADFFNDGLVLWQAPATWKYDGQKKAVTVQEPGNKAQEFGLAKDRSFRDFEFVFNARFVNGIGAAWVLRARNPQSYYLFELSAKEQKLLTYLVERGQKKLINTSTVLVPVDNQTPFQIRADVQGNRIRHYIKNNATGDEEQMGIAVDATHRYGTVGFTATNGQVYVIEDAFVRPYQETALPPSR